MIRLQYSEPQSASSGVTSANFAIVTVMRARGMDRAGEATIVAGKGNWCKKLGKVRDGATVVSPSPWAARIVM
jgi:hypothetical protein